MKVKSICQRLKRRQESLQFWWVRVEARERQLETIREEKRKQRRKKEDEEAKLRLEELTRKHLSTKHNILELHLRDLKLYCGYNPVAQEEIRRCIGLEAEAFAVRLKYLEETLNGCTH